MNKKTVKRLAGLDAVGGSSSARRLPETGWWRAWRGSNKSRIASSPSLATLWDEVLHEKLFGPDQ